MIPEGNLHTTTNSLTSTHLGLALDAFCRLKEPGNKSNDAVSVILHSYCGLESALNAIGYEMFENEKSQNYIPSESRNFLLKKFIKSWGANTQCLEKLEFIASHNGAVFPASLKNKLFELNNLRNWLAHGFSYSTTLLLEETDREGSYNVIDSEDDVDWKKKFPNCKFNSIVHLNVSDADKTLRIILETLIELSKMNMHYIFSVLCYYKGPNFKIVYRDTIVADLLECT